MSVPLRPLLFAITVLALALPARSLAQVPTPTTSQAAPGRVSVGVNAGLFMAPGTGLAEIGPNITFNSSRKRALQISTSFMADSDSYSKETWVLYAVQFRRTFKDEGSSRSYWTIGGAGVVYREHVNERTVTLLSGKTYTTNPHTNTFAILPLLPVVGIGTEKFVTPRLAIRADVVLSFLVARAALGFSVPLGRLK